MYISAFFCIVVTVLGTRIWILQRQVHNLLVAPPLPMSYVAGGNVTSHCERIQDGTKKLRYCEDAIVWTRNQGNLVLMSCDPGRFDWNTVMGPLRNPEPKGSIWSYDPSKKGVARINEILIVGLPALSDFHPLGIEVLPATVPSEPTYLFVVNHQRHASTVEQLRLEFESKTDLVRAHHVRTYSHPGLTSPNGIVPISSTSFFVTNDHYWTRRLPFLLGAVLPMMETALVLPTSWISLVELNAEKNITRVTKAISGLSFANGLAASPVHLSEPKDIRELAVASSNRMVVHLYEWNTRTNMIVHKENVEMPFPPDNISYDEVTGGIIVAGHPHFPTLIKFVKSRGSVSSPSWVLRLSRFANGTVPHNDTDAPTSAYYEGRAHPAFNHQLTTLYQSDGSHFGTSTTGVVDKGNLLITGLYAEGILQCQLSDI